MTAAMPRRVFLRASLAAGGAFVLAFEWQADATATAQSASLHPSGYVRIDPDGRVTIWSKNPDMGQGVKTALPMILAEELDAAWSQVTVVDAPLDRALYGGQGSGGSDSIRSSWALYRNAGAAAREMLAAAAADVWGVARDTLRTEHGAVHHPPTTRRLAYGDLAGRAAASPVPSAAAWKPTSRFTLLGTRVGGVDNAAIVTGRPLFGLDVRRPGLRFAAIAKCPVFGGRLVRVDDRAALAVPGVRQVVTIPGHANPTFCQPGVAVVADTTWAAFRGREALRIDWDEGEHGDESTATLSAQFGALASGQGTTVRAVGDVEAGLAASARVIAADYEAPFLAHATMEPVNCTAEFVDGRCHITGPLQMQTAGAGVVADVLGVPRERVHVQAARLGGGFGRRLLSDYAAEAAFIARATTSAIQVVGTRETDLRHDYFRPAGLRRLRVGLDARNRIHAWDCHVVNVSRNAYRRGSTPAWATETYGLVAGLSSDLAPDFELDLVPWHIPHVRLRYSQPTTGVQTGAWRAPAHVANAFAVETLLDEIATLTGRSAVDLRLELYGTAAGLDISSDEPRPYDPDRMAAVLRLAVDRSGFGRRAPEGRALGLAAHYTFGSYCAQVAEVSIAPTSGSRAVEGRASQRRVVVHRVTCAVDCGIVVNRSGVEAQAQGGIIDALGHAFYGEVTIDRGRAVESNFDRYRLIRMHEVPATIDVHVVPSTERPTGVGEIAVPVVAPAIANALAVLTGERLRSTPFQRHGLVLG